MDDPNYLFNVKMAIIKAILLESGVDTGDGGQAAHIDVPRVCVALTEVLADFIASSSDCDRPSDVRKVTDAWRNRCTTSSLKQSRTAIACPRLVGRSLHRFIEANEVKNELQARDDQTHALALGSRAQAGGVLRATVELPAVKSAVARFANDHPC